MAYVAALPVALAAQPATPMCGARNLDIGGGFSLTMYMFDGGREFFLKYDVPPRNVRTRDVVVATEPIRLTFYALDAAHRAEPQIGHENLDLRELDGREFEYGYSQFDCGRNVSLAATVSGRYGRPLSPGPRHFLAPFFVQRARIPACLEALERSGRFTLSFARRQGDPPSVIMRGRLPLRAKIRAARRLWTRDMARAERGECRLVPAPPPPP